MSKAIQLRHEIGEGRDREIQVLFADRWRKLVLIQLRREALLADHSALVPITIQAVVGKGILHVGSEMHELVPGVDGWHLEKFRSGTRVSGFLMVI